MSIAKKFAQSAEFRSSLDGVEMRVSSLADGLAQFESVAPFGEISEVYASIDLEKLMCGYSSLYGPSFSLSDIYFAGGSITFFVKGKSVGTVFSDV